MSGSKLPVHPFTGLTALWVRPDGRPCWPIAGASQAAPEVEPHPMLARLLEQRAERETFIEQLLDQVDGDERDLVDAERNLLNAARERIEQLDQDIEPLEKTGRVVAAHRASTRRYAAAPPASDPGGGSLGARTEPRPHQYASAGHFIVDLIHARGYFNQTPDPDAEARVASTQTRAAVPHQTTEETPGLLPEPIIGQILTDLDESRPFVESIGIQPLAGIPGKIFSRPTVTQHTLAAEQEAEKDELTSRQYKVDGIPFSKKTFGGWLNVSQQEIDWTSPSAWNALVADLQAAYGAATDDAAAADFAAGVTNVEAIEGDPTDGKVWIRGLYQAAASAATGDGTKRASALRLPNHVWTSLDQWATLGAAIDVLKVAQASALPPGAGSPDSFGGNILAFGRTMVPGFPLDTVIVGRRQGYEFWEQRLGVLEAIKPSVLGVEVASGGYVAYGFIDKTLFSKLTVTAPAPG